MQMVQFTCTECEGTVVAELIHIGRGGRCPHCGRPVIVPFIKLRTRSREDETRAMHSSGAGAVVIGPVQDEAYPNGVRLVSGDVEKRNHVRFPVADAKLTYAAGDREHGPFEVENLSRGGLSFLQSASEPPLDIDQDLSVTLSAPALSSPIVATGRVARVETVSDDAVNVGLQFVELAPDDFQRIRQLEKTTIPGSDSKTALPQP